MPRLAAMFCREIHAANPLTGCLYQMRPPDQIPNLSQQEQHRGATVYFWTGRNYTCWKIKSLHEFESALTIENGIGPMIVKPTECISEEIYLAEKLKDDTEEARQRYAEIIKHWNNGLRKSNDIGLAIGETARAVGQMIAAAKRWGLISSVISSDDKEAGATNSNQSG